MSVSECILMFYLDTLCLWITSLEEMHRVSRLRSSVGSVVFLPVPSQLVWSQSQQIQKDG